jgi:hypothetical protein
MTGASIKMPIRKPPVAENTTPPNIHEPMKAAAARIALVVSQPTR